MRQRDFVADASHELRTPLTSILANLELLEAELAEGEQREMAASALRSSRRMRRLVADLLLLAPDAAAGPRTGRSTWPRWRARRRPRPGRWPPTIRSR